MDPECQIYPIKLSLFWVLQIYLKSSMPPFKIYSAKSSLAGVSKFAVTPIFNNTHKGSAPSDTSNQMKSQ